MKMKEMLSDVYGMAKKKLVIGWAQEHTTTTHMLINAVNVLSGTDNAQTIMFLLKHASTPTCMKMKFHPRELCIIV